jgi:hypothetical protein
MTLLNYCSLQTKKSNLNYFLWDFVSPAWTALFLILTGAYFMYKKSNSVSDEETKAYNEAGMILIVWGLFNFFIYIVLVANNAKQMSI